ncbi:acetyltransferase [Ekhidna sp.]|uniref:acetyltransferase n=1 Tax=Ekhidna sp. TaxID=2608089 RepID=UPI003296A971
MKSKKLILFGDSAFADIAYEYFTHDSEYEVVAFTVSEAYLNKKKHFDLPVVPFEKVENYYPPGDHDMFIALVYNNLNRIRTSFYTSAKAKGYTMANYISSRAFVWSNVEIGDNVFIFEDNTVQPFVKIGSNVILWSGNHLGHHSNIEDHCFISSHVVISGFCNIGTFCFLGVNATINNNITIGKDCLLGSGSLVVKDISDGTITKGQKSEISSVSTYNKFKI